MPDNPRPIFVFVDESGNFDFSANGTKHFVMAAVVAHDPIASASAIQQVKYDLLSEGSDVKHFHASEDRQFIRDRVFAVINSLASIHAHVFFVDKHYTAPALQNPARMYSLFGAALAKFLFTVLPEESYSRLVVIFDKALTNKNEGAFLAEVKPKLNALGRPYRIYFQSVNFDFNGQIADYIAWAQFVSLERDENRPLNSIPNLKEKITSFDLFRTGHTKYY